MNEHLFKNQGYALEWSMTPAERCAFVYILQLARADLALEIGSGKGGTSQAIARFCKRAVSLDLDGDHQSKLRPLFPNVDYRTGDSHRLLPEVMQELQEGEDELGFVFVDGDHTEAGVREDINHILSYRPQSRPLYVLCHDAFNPDCRRGILGADWEGNPHVHHLEIDFVAGIFHWSPSWFKYLWGGLTLAILLPEERQEPLVRLEHHRMLFQAAYPFSVHCR
ncbi:MAG: class I SAM-dependent methyltransferase, partial [Candidatus Methylacidiphilales bacterium]